MHLKVFIEWRRLLAFGCALDAHVDGITFPCFRLKGVIVLHREPNRSLYHVVHNKIHYFIMIVSLRLVRLRLVSF